MSVGEEWNFWIFFFFFFFFSLFVGLSADRIILSFLLRKSPSHKFLRAYYSGVQGISKQPGLAHGSHQQSSSLLNTGENIPLWATLGMCLGCLAGSFQPWKCPRQPSLCLKEDPAGEWFSPLSPCSCEFIKLPLHGASLEELPYSK